MKPSVIICLFNHGTGEPLAEGYCPTCLKIACAEKDKRITELCDELRSIREATSADPRIANFLMKAAEFRDQITKLNARLEGARSLIQHIGWTSSERTDIIQCAEKWLEGKP